MRSLMPGLLMLAESVVFLALEWRLRRASRWRRGSLDHLSLGIVAGPLVVFLLAALVFSTGGWDLLRLSGVLTVLALPIGLGAGLRAVRPGSRWQPPALALALSVTGLVVLALSSSTA